MARPPRLLLAPLGWVLVFTALVAPMQYSLPVAGVRLTAADLGVMLAGLLVALYIWRHRPLREFLPPVSHVGFLLLLAPSLYAMREDNNFQVGAWLREWLQLVAAFLIAWVAVCRGCRVDTLRLRVLWALLAGALLACGWATVDYLLDSRAVLEVSGPFGNRNVYGLFVAFVVPLCLALLVTDACTPRMRMIAGAVVVLGCLTQLSGGAALAMVVGGVVAVAASRPALVPAWLLFVALLGGLGHHLPRENTRELAHSLRLFDEDADMSLEARLAEWQVGAQMWDNHRLFGVGLGQYQRLVGQYAFYIEIPEGPKEPDRNNLWMVLASCTGILGMTGFLWMLGHWFHLAVRLTDPGSLPGAIGAGLLGALLVFVMANVWSSFLVRGLMHCVVIWLALGASLVHRQRDLSRMR